MVIVILSSFIKIGGEIKCRYAPKLILQTCEDTDLEKVSKFIFLNKLNIQRLKSDNLDLINSPNIKEFTVMTTTNHDAYHNMPDFKKLKMFYSVGLDFDDLSYFSSMNRLKELYLGLGYTDNRIMSSGSFDSLPVSLERICLNGIENTDSLDFSKLNKLKSVYISYSSLSSINIDNPDLEILSLPDNALLTNIYISAKTVKLKSISVNKCPNIEINIDNLKNLSSLEHLTVSKGTITESDIENLLSLGVEVKQE